MFLNGYPYTDFHEMNLDFLLRSINELKQAFKDFTASNSLIFADPIYHDITTTYAKNTIVIDAEGNAYIAKQNVPSGVQLGNTDYWMLVFDFEGYVERANKNFTVNYFSNVTRSDRALEVDDWLVLDDVLYKVIADIPVDGEFIIGTNIVHFTVEQFLIDFTVSITALVNQYKDDIDASELAYVAAMQAEVDRILAGATVDSEVIDARLGANGINYATLGIAIRTQIGTLNTKLDNNTMTYNGVLANNTDLNTVYHNGWYVTATSSHYTHSPESDSATGYRFFIVYSTLNPTETANKLQLYRNNTTGVTAIRSYISNSSTWTDWQILATTADVDAVNSVVNTQVSKIVESLHDNTDLNDLYKNGWYVGAASYTFDNTPEPDGTTGYRFIIIYGLSSPTATSNKMMVYYNAATEIFAIRTMRTLTWGEWSIIPTLENLQNHADYSLQYMRCLSYEPYPDETQDDYVAHKIMGCCLCGKKVMYALDYSSSNQYYFGALTLGSTLYRVSANNKYNLVLNIGGVDTPMRNLTDGNGNHFSIVDMKAKGSYLYLALRGGTGLPDLTATNGYMVAIDTSDMSVIGYDTSHGKTSALCVFENYLISGEQSGGWSIYTLADGVPTRKYRYEVASLSPYEGEWQRPFAFRNNGTMYIAFARYTSGFNVYSYDEDNNTIQLVASFNSANLAEIGSNLNIFDVAVDYPYVYATISPTSSNRLSGNNMMGIATIDITDPLNMTYTYEQIPEHAVGIMPQYYSVASDGTLTRAGGGDPDPNRIYIEGDYIYTNNEDKGIAVFEIAGDGTVYKGNVDIGVWPKYFDVNQGVIFANSRFDYMRGEKPLITATKPIIFS